MVPTRALRADGVGQKGRAGFRRRVSHSGAHVAPARTQAFRCRRLSLGTGSSCFLHDCACQGGAGDRMIPAPVRNERMEGERP